jgi:hypothetical protein
MLRKIPSTVLALGLMIFAIAAVADGQNSEDGSRDSGATEKHLGLGFAHGKGNNGNGNGNPHNGACRGNGHPGNPDGNGNNGGNGEGHENYKGNGFGHRDCGEPSPSD